VCIDNMERLKITDSLNQFHFEQRGSANPQPYYMQGTAAFEETPVKQRRSAIAESSKVQSVAMQFWTTAGLKAEDTMPKHLYIYVHRRVCKALAPELTEAEAAEAAEEDWNDDVQGDERMTFKQCALHSTHVSNWLAALPPPSVHSHAPARVCSSCVSVHQVREGHLWRGGHVDRKGRRT
jgi:hypothetical protein